ATIDCRLLRSHAETNPTQATTRSWRLRRNAIRERAPARHGFRRHARTTFHRLPLRYAAQWLRAASSLWLRQLRNLRAGQFQLEPAELAGPRRDLRRRARPRRRRARKAVARCGAHETEAQHVFGLHRLGRTPDCTTLHDAGKTGD